MYPQYRVYRIRERVKNIFTHLPKIRANRYPLLYPSLPTSLPSSALPIPFLPFLPHFALLTRRGGDPSNSHSTATIR